MNYNNLFEFEMIKLAQAEVERLMENLTNPATVVDYSDYKYQIGKIAGLRAAIDLCEDVNTILSER